MSIGWSRLEYPLALPITLPWSSGRFYEASCTNVTGYGSAAINTGAVTFVPFVVPSRLTIATLGIEVVGAGAAGTKCRLAIYDDNRNCHPDVLVVDSGQLAEDAIAFVSAVINLVVGPGFYWACYAHNGGGSIRTQQNGFVLPYLGDQYGWPNSYRSCLTYGNQGATMVANGFPGRFPDAAYGNNYYGWDFTTNNPRIMLGV